MFDDVVFPGIRKLLRFLSQLPDYKVDTSFPASAKQSKSRKVEYLRKVFPFINKVLKEDYFLMDSDLAINTHCVALKKLREDSRNWDFHKAF